MFTHVKIDCPDSRVNHIIHCRKAPLFVTLASMAGNEFEEWVKELVQKHFGGKFQKFADEVGVTFSALSRSARKGSTSIVTLLRIGISTGVPPEELFTIAGKRHVHDLITKLYGKAGNVRLSKRAIEVGQAFDSLEDEAAKSFYLTSLKAHVAEQQALERIGAPSRARTATGHGKSGTRRNRPNRA